MGRLRLRWRGDGKPSRVAVSRDALVKRINRVLRHDDDVLHVTRGERLRWDVGDYYTMNLRVNCVGQKSIDLEQFGRELKVLKPHEYVAELEGQ